MLKFDTDTHKLYSDNENCLVYNEEMKVFPTDFVYLPFYATSLIFAEYRVGGGKQRRSRNKISKIRRRMKKLILTFLLSLSFFAANAETKFENRKMDYVVVPSFLLMKQFGVQNDKILHYAVGYYATTLMQNHLDKWSKEHKWIKNSCTDSIFRSVNICK